LYACSSSNIIRKIKLGRMSWTWHVARLENIKNPHKMLVENPEGTDHLEDLIIDWKTIMTNVLNRMAGS
jgi:hypothetical protein